MGTRNLTMVINKKGKTKIAQYGQWDGYPGGQGKTSLEFLKTQNLNNFQKQIKKCFFYKEVDLPENATIDEYPQLNRDHGASVLSIVNGISDKLGLKDSSDFAYDSLFCEWVYIIDFSKNTFEIYTGFQQSKLDKNQRFYQETPNDSGYYGVKMIDSYELDNLPDVDEFIYNFTDEGFEKRQREKKLNRILHESIF